VPDWSLIFAWSLFLAFILLLLSLDLFVLHRNPHKIAFREALLGTLLPVIAALVFVAAVYVAYEKDYIVPTGTPNYTGREAAVLFLTGYLVELSLSADNVFLFLILMKFFVVPANLQHRVLFWGVLGALILRALMIAGIGFLLTIHWVLYAFGLLLLYSAAKMLLSHNQTPDPSRSLIIRLAQKQTLLPIVPRFEGNHFLTRINGRRAGTTLLLVLIAIELTDLVFAIDSIPAVFGVTRDTFLVFTSNVFAILGLRSMYFLLAGIMNRFHLLHIGLALVLAFVGTKMLLPAAAELYAHLSHAPIPNWTVNSYLSLAIIAACLLLSITASLLLPPKQSQALDN